MATKPKERKERGDSKLATLDETARQALIDGMLSGWTYEQAREWLGGECGVSLSLSALTPFYRRHVEPVLRERKQFAALSAKTLGEMARESAAFDAAAIGELKEYAYTLFRDPAGDPEEKRKWMETLIKAQAGHRDERKILLLERKAAQADEAKEVVNSDLGEAEKRERLKQIFRM